MFRTDSPFAGLTADSGGPAAVGGDEKGLEALLQAFFVIRFFTELVRSLIARGEVLETPADKRKKNYSSFPGFMIPLGSNTRLISRINRNSTASLLCRKWSRLSCPMPCSAEMLPP